MVGQILDVLMFVAMCTGILLGFPVVFTLMGIAVIFAAAGWAFGAFDPVLLGALSQRIFGTLTNQVLIAIPLFVFMGIMLERSKIAEQLLEEMGRLFGALRGGLAISVSIVGALLAASTGIVGATVITMGLIALPTMMNRGYDPRLAAGTVCAAGTLGQIIPPSTMLVILGEVMSAAYQQAQFQQGLFSIQTVSVGQMFAGAMIPGLMLVGLYIVYQAFVAWLHPAAAPAMVDDGQPRVSVRRLAGAMAPPIVLIVAVLGSILGGVATPTEAASVGAIGATLLAGFRADPQRGWPILLTAACIVAMLALASVADMRLGREEPPLGDRIAIFAAFVLSVGVAFGIVVAFLRVHRSGVLVGVVTQTMKISAMIFATLIAASLFALVFRGLGGDDLVHEVLSGVPGGQLGAIVFVMVLIFLLGFVLDFVEISIIVIPIVGPVLLMMGLDPIWLGVMLAMNLQTSFMTPPFGFSLFYLRGAAPREVRTVHIYRGVVPFVVIQLTAIVVIYLVPELATWLPGRLFG